MGTVENTPKPLTPRGPAARRVGVCTWSLHPGSLDGLLASVRATGLSTVHLGLEPLRTGVIAPDAAARELAAAGMTIASGALAFPSEDYSTLETIRHTGGVAPDDAWPEILAASETCADIARTVGIPLVTFHAGWLPHDPHDPRRAVLLERIREVARRFVEQGIGVALETGQETADTLLELLGDLGDLRVGVNFDPANMILYGMGDPIVALERLAPHVRQLHLKDALPAVRPGEWGTEVPAGEGAVDWAAFFRILEARLPGVNVMIEREAGTQRVEDIRQAAGLAAHYLGGLG
ncbi:MAG: sugar phosphate isomerase/epimerase family protein [Gemmatimonadales bacterium]